MLLNQIIPSFLEFFLLYMVLHIFLQISLTPNRQDVLTCLLVLCLSVLTNDYIIVSWLLGQLVYLLYTIYLHKGRLLNRILLYSVTYIVLILFQLLVIFIMNHFGHFYNDRLIPFIGSSIWILVTLVLLLLTPLRKLYSLLEQATLFYKILTINTYLILASFMLLLKFDTHTFYQNIIYIICVLLLISIINACVIFYEKTLQLDQQRIASYEDTIPNYENLIDEIRASQHEFSNRLQTLGELPSVCKDYDSLSKELQKNVAVYKQPAKAYDLLQLNMPLLSATLYKLYKQAIDKGLSLLFDISATEIESRAPEYDLTDYVNILTQNAIEASQPGDTIYIQMQSEGGILHFEVRNQVASIIDASEITRFFQKRYSTKNRSEQQSHGMGLHYLSKQLQKNNGVLGADCITYNNKNWIVFFFEI